VLGKYAVSLPLPLETLAATTAVVVATAFVSSLVEEIFDSMFVLSVVDDVVEVVVGMAVVAESIRARLLDDAPFYSHQHKNVRYLLTRQITNDHNEGKGRGLPHDYLYHHYHYQHCYHCYYHCDYAYDHLYNTTQYGYGMVV
jgi:hypothetical protein